MSEIRLFAGDFAPKSWAFCAGQILAIAQNSALFSLLGTTYGGNGVTTFALPDFRGRVPMGTGSGPALQTVVLGEMTGLPQVTLTSINLPAHTHIATSNTFTQPAFSDVGTSPSPTGNYPASLNNLYSNATADTQMRGFSSSLTLTPAGSSQPINIEQPYLGINYVICLYGVYPSRS